MIDDIIEIEPASTRTRTILLAVLGAVTALGLLYLLVLGPMLAPEETAAAPPLPAPAGDAAAPAPAEDDTLVEAVPAPLAETYISGTVRSPFQQVVVADAAATADTTADGALVATTAPIATTAEATSTTAEGTSSGEATTGETSTPPARQVGTALVRLVGVTAADGPTRAHVTVDGEGHMVAAGETFAAVYRLDSITGDCGTFTVADRQFTLCAGQELRK